MEKYDILIKLYLGMAQIGSALPWGGRGRGFKSRYSDQNPSFVRTADFLLCLRIYIFVFHFYVG